MSFYGSEFIKELEKDLQKNPKSKSFSTLAHVYYTEGELSKAKSICLEGLKYHSSYISPYLLLADISLKENDMDKALNFLNRAKEISPENVKVYEKMAHIYTKKGQLEESLKTYKILIAIQPHHQMALDYVSYLEKIIPQKASPAEVSSKSQKKLIKLNQILARVQNYIQEKGL